MTLTPTIKSVSDLFRKLERECYRATHCRNAIHRGDHFLNFCITAHAMRDHLSEHLGIVGDEARSESYTGRWKERPELQAAADIANAAKHFVLRDPRTRKLRKPPTKSVRKSSNTYVDIYLRADGNAMELRRVEIPDYFVRTSDGHTYCMYSFMQAVVDFWKDELATNRMPTRRQPLRSLIG
jgi:hypothetical protein